MKKKEPLVQLTDLTAISRDADRCLTAVTLYQENLRHFPVEWIRAGRGSLYPVNNYHRPGLWILAALLGRGATDSEHDSPFAFKLPLVGVDIERVEQGCVLAHGFVDAYDGEEFRVPRPGYDPLKKRGASTCRIKSCGAPHPIVPDGCHVPKFDAALYEAVKGRLVDIRMIVLSPKANTCAPEDEDEVIDHCNGCGGEWPPQEDDVCPKCKPGPGLIRTFNERQAERFRTGERWTNPEPGED